MSKKIRLHFWPLSTNVHGLYLHIIPTEREFSLLFSIFPVFMETSPCAKCIKQRRVCPAAVSGNEKKLHIYKFSCYANPAFLGNSVNRMYKPGSSHTKWNTRRTPWNAGFFRPLPGEEGAGAERFPVFLERLFQFCMNMQVWAGPRGKIFFQMGRGGDFPPRNLAPVGER